MHTRSMLPVALTGLALGAFAPTAALAGDDTEAVACARQKVWDSYSEGWGLRTIASAGLSLGETATWKVTLYPGRTYRFVGCGDKRTLDLDLILYGSDGKPVKRDDTTNGQPVFEYTSDQIGSYYLVAHSRKIDDPSKPVEIAIAVTHK